MGFNRHYLEYENGIRIECSMRVITAEEFDYFLSVHDEKTGTVVDMEADSEGTRARIVNSFGVFKVAGDFMHMAHGLNMNGYENPKISRFLFDILIEWHASAIRERKRLENLNESPFVKMRRLIKAGQISRIPA